jgi:hypothetical protein
VFWMKFPATNKYAYICGFVARCDFLQETHGMYGVAAGLSSQGDVTLWLSSGLCGGATSSPRRARDKTTTARVRVDLPQIGCMTQ